MWDGDSTSNPASLPNTRVCRRSDGLARLVVRRIVRGGGGRVVTAGQPLRVDCRHRRNPVIHCHRASSGEMALRLQTRTHMLLTCHWGTSTEAARPLLLVIH